MKSLLEKIDTLLPTPNNRHSFFQIKHFMIGKEPTVQGRLHSCLRELRERRNTLEAIELELAEQFDNKLLLEERAKKLANRDNTISQIKLRKLNRKIKAVDKQLAGLREKVMGIEQESLFIIELYENLLTQEELREWDDFKVQGEYWNAKLLHELKVSLLLSGHISNDLVSSIMALPDQSPAKQQLIGVYQAKLIKGKESAESHRLETKADT